MPIVAENQRWERTSAQGEAIELKRYIADRKFLDSLHDELLHRYTEQWVALYSHQIVGNAKTLGELVKQLEERHIDPSKSVIEFLTTKKRAMIL